MELLAEAVEAGLMYFDIVLCYQLLEKYKNDCPVKLSLGSLPFPPSPFLPPLSSLPYPPSPTYFGRLSTKSIPKIKGCPG